MFYYIIQPHRPAVLNRIVKFHSTKDEQVRNYLDLIYNVLHFINIKMRSFSIIIQLTSHTAHATKSTEVYNNIILQYLFSNPSNIPYFRHFPHLLFSYLSRDQI